MNKKTKPKPKTKPKIKRTVPVTGPARQVAPNAQTVQAAPVTPPKPLPPGVTNGMAYVGPHVILSPYFYG